MTGLRNAVRRPRRGRRPTAPRRQAKPSGGPGTARYFLRATSVTCAVFRQRLLTARATGSESTAMRPV